MNISNSSFHNESMCEHHELLQMALCDNIENITEIFNNLPYSVAAIFENKIIFANNKLLELVELNDLSQIMHKNLTEIFIFQTKGLGLHIEEILQSLNTVQNRSVETQILCFNGLLKNVQIHTNAIVFRKGILHLLSFYDHPLIELKKKMLANKKLLDETLEYDKVKTEFFSNLSHEFRTPLNIINSSIQLLSLHLTGVEMNHKDKIDKCTTIMKQNCNRLLRLINNLIDITRIHSGFFDLVLQNYDIVPLVQQIVNSVSTYTENKGISLTFSTSIKKKMIACDADKIERILLNLLSNAIKFNQPGGSIIVKLYQSKNQIALSIKDTGIGIEKRNLSILFQRFRQVDKSLSRNQEGSGLGLSIVKSLVELHHGRITVKSVLGKGSEFIIYLPINKIEQPPEIMNANELLQSDRIERMNIEFSDIYI